MRSQAIIQVCQKFINHQQLQQQSSPFPSSSSSSSLSSSLSSSIENNSFYQKQTRQQLNIDFQNEQFNSNNNKNKIENSIQMDQIQQNDEIKQNSNINHQIQPNYSVDNVEKQITEAYLKKWTKQVEFFYMKQKELHYYILSHKDEVLQTQFNKQHPINIEFPYFINLSQIISFYQDNEQEFDEFCQENIDQIDNQEYEQKQQIDKVKKFIDSGKYQLKDFNFVDYDEEYDDKDDELNPLAIKKFEISEDSYEQIVQNFIEQQQIKYDLSKYPQAYFKTKLQFALQSVLNPRMFMERILDKEYQPLIYFKDILVKGGIDFELFRDNMEAVSCLMSIEYIDLCKMMRDQAILNLTQKLIHNQQYPTSQLPDSSSTSSSSSSASLLQINQSQQQDNHLIVLNKELMGVMKHYPNYFIPFVAYNALRFKPILTSRKFDMIQFIKIYPEDKTKALFLQQFTVKTFELQGFVSYNAKCQISKSSQINSNKMEQILEMSFDEEPDVQLQFKYSQNDTLESLKVMIEQCVNNNNNNENHMLNILKSIQELQKEENDLSDDENEDQQSSSNQNNKQTKDNQLVDMNRVYIFLRRNAQKGQQTERKLTHSNVEQVDDDEQEEEEVIEQTIEKKIKKP